LASYQQKQTDSQTSHLLGIHLGIKTLTVSVAVGLGQISLSPSAASRLKMWEITTVSRVMRILPQCFILNTNFF
jgi:hypothetical protein